jgi:hypothetical protein
MPVFLLKMDRNMTTTESAISTAAGSVLTIGVLYILATNGDPALPLQDPEGSLELAASTIINGKIPQTASDVVSVAIGEAFAGIVGAAVSFGVSRSIQTKDYAKSKENLKVSDAVADGDFLLTNAAAFPLFESLGLPPVLATLLAIVPSSFGKLGAKRLERLKQEERFLQQMYQEDQRLRQQFGFRQIIKQKKQPSTVDPNQLVPVQDVELDLVEVFSDSAKWLQYSVLKSDFGGLLSWNGATLVPGAEAAIFGSVAAMSSQVYSDVLYAYFGFGGEAKREMVRSRSLADWIMVYGSRFIYYAVLFGVYEAVQIPTKHSVNAFLSGGVGNCYDSDDFATCIDTYTMLNPPAASPEAQLRAFIIASLSLWDDLLFYGEPQLRAFIVAAVSWWYQLPFY